ncbi:hypothetical protein G6L00_32150 [Agrobacterium rhizogenes]|nr:hypothetical protein [Rhizobium rhizogenes]NTF78933.1 hypothetical protein [Rhizobium rhizogenes]NTG25101.1 hypothetical protein [Rhizobium rhizogenes]NTG38872.1 hypothetical protein [Rhizobium rhizogenes]NTG58005.1 hypothetical protein [Rhizobium rhizogenes]
MTPARSRLSVNEGALMMRIVRVPFLALVIAAFAALPGCASHKELKAPCSARISSVFSSQAYAGGITDRCGPMVRQKAVTIL